MLESYYENKLRTGVQKLGNGVRCLKFESPGFSGVPDRIILLPGAKVIFVETKKPGKMERKRQLYVQGQLRAKGLEEISADDSVQKIEAVLARSRDEKTDQGILPA